MKKTRNMLAAAVIGTAFFVLTGCGIEGGGEPFRILSGSENQELEAVLEACGKETGVDIEMTYQGSVDIMRALQQGGGDYDAVWPASSLWLTLGDTGHKVKYAESISTTPVVFGGGLTKGYFKGDSGEEALLLYDQRYPVQLRGQRLYRIYSGISR